MKNKVYRGAFGVLMAAFFLVLGSCSEESKSYTVNKMDIVESVYSSVIIEPKSLYTVNASNSGYIDELLIEVGDEVKLNQVLFSIRDVQSRNTAANARLAYEIARKNYNGDVSLLDDLKMELKDARLKQKNDSINYYRNKELYEKDLVTQVEFEQSELAYESSRTRSGLIANKIKRSQDDLKASLEQARNNYESSLSRYDDAYVRSKVEGKVYDVFKETGEFAAIQQPVALVGEADRFVIKMKIDEADITKVKKGQTIIVSLEAYENKTFEAVVTRISPRMDQQTQTFEVEGEFKKAPEALFMGLTGEGNIVILERKSVLVIPLEYLMEEDYVMTSNGKVKVKTGAKSLSHVEIISGIKEGEELLKPE